jgi:phenylalanyl-tRNA synthetase beta chain
MRISLNHLRRYCPALPAGPVEVRQLMDDVGLEVKRMEEGEDPAVVIEFLANRGDHRSYAGIAREIAARLRGPLLLPPVLTLAAGEPPVRLRIESDLCLLYTATLIEVDPEAGETTLPAEVLHPLIAAEMQSVSPWVDATNIANLELGQPTHVFDADAIAGGITVRLSRQGERAWLLFQPAPITLDEGILVIADDEKILGIAGVIGCEDSKATAASRRLLLESAAFDPVAVRKGSRRLRVSTDASARFERGCDPALPLTGAGRVAHLLETWAGAHHRGVGVAGDWRDPERTIALRPDRVGAYFHRPFPAAEIAERLAGYGFTISTGSEGSGGPEELAVRVPSARLWDVHNREDLYEELARNVGYDELPLALPPVAMGVQESPWELTRKRVEEVLLGLGFYEVMTNGFYSRQLAENLGIAPGHPLWEHVETVNALDRSFSLLKNNGIAQAVEAAADNLRFGVDEIKMYEWTRTFHRNPAAANGVNDEREILWLIATGPSRDPSWADKPRPIDVWYLKGIVEDLGTELRLPLEVAPPDPEAPLYPVLHPYRQGAIRLDGRRVGILGELDPAVARAFGIKKARPYYLEIEAEALRREPRPVAFSLPPQRPPSVRMLAFTLGNRVEAGEVASCLRENGPDWLRKVSIVDLFEHEENGEPVRTVTFALDYRNDLSEHSIEEMNAVSEALVRAVEKELGERGVRLR